MKLSTAAIFSEDMVLQSGKPLPVWGQGTPGTAVRCALAPAAGGQGVQADTTVGQDGQWRLTLPALPAGGPFTMTVESGAERCAFPDVWLGEVWLAGGQSNMELELQNSRDGAQALAACANPRLHFYAVPKVTTGADADAAEQGARWRVVGPQTAATMSAVAYYAARTLARHLDNLHIGVICCYWGGTFAHCWLPRTELQNFPEGRARIAEYDARMGDKTEEQFAAECAAYQKEVDAWNDRIDARRAADPAVSWATLNAECGVFPWPPPAGRTGYQRPGNLYESMLRRVCPYALRGFWYYQGEQDEEHAGDYRALLTRLVRRWRADWGDRALPFLVVQLPMYGSEFDWPALRAAQSAVVHHEPNMALAVLTDCGEEDNIHPTDKQTPGTRLGLLTLQTVYHAPVQGLAPEMTCVDFAGSRALIRFANAAGGLRLAGQGRGFELAGRDGVFHPARAEILAPDTVRLHCSAVLRPVAVRYAWHSFGPAELFGGTGLAAAPLCYPTIYQ